MYDFDLSQLKRLLLASEKRLIAKGHVIRFESNKFYLNYMSGGFIKRYLITDDGGQSIQVIYGKGDVFPLTPLFNDLLSLQIYKGEETLYYEAMTDVEVHSLDKQKLLEVVAASPELFKDLFYISGTRLSSNIQRLENVSLRSSERKIIDLLIYYSNRFSTVSANEIRLTVPLTHQTIANVLSLTRETVTHTMVRLQDRSLIEQRTKGIIIILDVEELYKFR